METTAAWRVLWLAALLAGAHGCKPAQPAQQATGAGTGSWTATASAMGVPGDRFSFDCPAGGTASSVWGDGTYTADSSVCTAAVHAGLLTFAYGGRITIEVAAGLGSYSGSTRHGVTTNSYGSWNQSFFFPRASWFSTWVATPPPPPPTPPPSPSPTATLSAWTPIAVATPVIGDRKSIDCDGTAAGAVWGSDVYTADSNPCRAAVHAGVLAPGAAGQITIEYVAGESAYVSTTRNGISTSSWQSYPLSFVFPGGGVKAPPQTLSGAFATAKLDEVLDRTFVSTGADSWEVSIFRDGTTLVSKRSVSLRMNVIATAKPLVSDPDSVRVAITGTMYRYETGKPVSSPIAAQLVFRAGLRGVEIAEESRVLGIGSDGTDFAADDRRSR